MFTELHPVTGWEIVGHVAVLSVAISLILFASLKIRTEWQDYRAVDWRYVPLILVGLVIVAVSVGVFGPSQPGCCSMMS